MHHATLLHRASLVLLLALMPLGLCGCPQQPPSATTSGPPNAPPPTSATGGTQTSTPTAQPARSEAQKIEWLLEQTTKSDAVFIRNGAEASGKDAATLLRNKLRSAGDRIKTARDFIDQLASASSTTGTPYQIRTPDGVTVESRIWFTKLLESLESQNAPPQPPPPPRPPLRTRPNPPHPPRLRPTPFRH